MEDENWVPEPPDHVVLQDCDLSGELAYDVLDHRLPIASQYHALEDVLAPQFILGPAQA